MHRSLSHAAHHRGRARRWARRHIATLSALALVATVLPMTAGQAVTDPWIALNPVEGDPGTPFTVSGCGSKPNSSEYITWWDVDDTYAQPLGTPPTDADGCFSLDTSVPGGAQPGEHRVAANVGDAVFTVPGDTSSLDPTVTVAPASGPPGRTVTISGCDWPARDVVDVVFDPGGSATALGWDVAGDDGCFSTTGTIPTSASAGTRTVRATGTSPGATADTTFGVAATSGAVPDAAFTWRVADRLGATSGAVTDPADLNPSANPLTVILDGCISTSDTPIVEYRWDITPVATDGEGTPDVPTEHLVPSGCRTTWKPPLGGEYDVALTVLTSGGKSESTSRTIRPRDLFVVSLGDSYSSGEGNPDVKGDYWDFNPFTDPDYAEWSNLRCHRSSIGWPYQVAHYLETEYPAYRDTARVSYVGLACSGAKIENFAGNAHDGGILEPYAGVVPPCPEGTNLCVYQDLPSQVDQLRSFIATAGRAPDLVLVSIGGNDIGFADIIEDCLIVYCESDFNDNLHDKVAERLRALPAKFDRMAAAFDELGIDPSTVHLLEYPNATRNENGELDSCSYPTTTDDDFGWVETHVIYPLSDAIEQATQDHGWQLLSGPLEAFRNHGICASGSHRWFRDISESLDMQGDINGAFHPNWAGHRSIRNLAIPLLDVASTPSALGDVTVTARPAGLSARPLHDGASFVGSVAIDIDPASPLVDVSATVNGQPYTSGATIGTDGRSYRPVVLTISPRVRATSTRDALPLPVRRYRFELFDQPASPGDLLAQVAVDVVYNSRRHPQGRILDRRQGLDLGAFLTEAGLRATTDNPSLDVTMTAQEHAPGVGDVGSPFALANGQLLRWDDSGESTAFYRDVDRYEVLVTAKLGSRTETGKLYLAVTKNHHTILSQVRLTHRYPVVTGYVDEWWYEYDTDQGRLVQRSGTRRNFAGEVTPDVDVQDHDLVLDTPMLLDGKPYEPGTPITDVGDHDLDVFVCFNIIGDCTPPAPGATSLGYDMLRLTPANEPVNFTVLPADAWEADLASAGSLPARPADCPTCVFDPAQGAWIDLADRACPNGDPNAGPDRCTVWRDDGPVGRFYGPDRIETALSVSRQAFDVGAAGAVVLARADLFPDALVGTPLAVKQHAPMLLSFPDQLDERVATEIERVLPAGGSVYLLGGTAALSPSVASAISDAGFQVKRLAGANRYATAVAIARELGDVNEVLIATGEKFPDGLAAGAAAGVRNAAVVLTPDGWQVDVTNEYLAQHPAATRYAVGYPAFRAYPDTIPLAGADRHDTAVSVAERFFPNAQLVGLARSDAFPDALSGGAHVSSLGGPILLTPPGGLPSSVTGYVDARGVQVGVIYGGQAAVSDQAASEFAAAIR